MRSNGKSVAIVGLVTIGTVGMASLVVLAVTNHDTTSAIGQIVVFAGTIVTALVAYLKGNDATAAKDIGLDNSARIDEVHAQVNHGTATIMTQLGKPTAPDNPVVTGELPPP